MMPHRRQLIRITTPPKFVGSGADAGNEPDDTGDKPESDSQQVDKPGGQTSVGEDTEMKD